jgi:hypothetical protein
MNSLQPLDDSKLIAAAFAGGSWLWRMLLAAMCGLPHGR